MRILAQNRWPWQLHATYDETIARALDVFERINRGYSALGPELVRSRGDDLRSLPMDPFDVEFAALQHQLLALLGLCETAFTS